MNGIDIAIIVIVVAVTATVVGYLVRRKIKGKPFDPGCDCCKGDCACCGKCAEKTDPAENTKDNPSTL